MKLDWNTLGSGERIILTDRSISLDKGNYDEIKFALKKGYDFVGLETEYIGELVGVTFPTDLPAGEYIVSVRAIVRETNLKKEKKNCVFKIFLPPYKEEESLSVVRISQHDDESLAGLRPLDDEIILCANMNGDLIKKDVSDGKVVSENISQKIKDLEEHFLNIEIDESLDPQSVNPVQNKAISVAIGDLDDRLELLESEIGDFTFKAPSTQLTLFGDTSDVDLTSDNLLRRVTGFTHKETNIKNISGSLNLKKGSSQILKSEIKPSENFALVTLDSVYSVTFTAIDTITFTLVGTNVKGAEFSSSASISSYYPAFYGAYSTEPTDLSALTKIRSLSGTRSITVSGEPQYIWFATTGSISKITSAGFDVPFEQDGTLSYKNGNYKLYRTSEKIIAGTYSYIIS